jgi:hypothetical protein
LWRFLYNFIDICWWVPDTRMASDFGPHDDKSVHLDEGCSTENTLLVYLSGGVGGATVSPLVGRETVFYTSCKQIVAQVTTTKFHFYVLQDGIEKIPEKL